MRPERSRPLNASTRPSWPERVAAPLTFDQQLLQTYRLDPLFAPHAEICFKKRAVLGEGGMGTVFRVEDQRLGRQAALKILKDPVAAEDLIERFLKEARIMGRLNHPGIPPLHEAGRTRSGHVYMLMRLVEGQTLKERIQRYHDQERPLEDLRELLEALIKVAEAVAYAHSQGIVHRDLKPANIMIGAFGEVMVLDWGIAKDLSESESAVKAAPIIPAELGLTIPGSVMGTPGYMAPEQASGEAVDRRADVFSLGALLCNLLTHSSPIAGNNALERLTNTIKGRIQSPLRLLAGVPRELDALAAWALAFDKEARLPSPEDFASELRCFLSGRELSSVRYSAAERGQRFLRRRPRFLLAAFLVSMSLGAAGILWQSSVQARQREQRILASIKAFSDSRVLVRRGRPLAELENRLNEALEKGGRSYPLLLEAARVYEDGSHFDEARALLNEADKRFYPAYEALFYLHSLEIRGGDQFQSSLPLRTLQKRAREEGLVNEFSLYAEAQEHYDNGDHRRALALANRAIEHAPYAHGSYVLSGILHLRLREHDRALLAFDKALELQPKSVPALLSRGSTYQLIGRLEDAYDDYNKAIFLAPRYAEIYFNRGLLFLRRLNFRRAREDFDQCLILKPEYSDAHVNRGTAHASLGARDKAHADFGRALALDPKNPRAYCQQGLLFLKEGKLDQALEKLNKALELDPRLASAYNGRAYIFSIRKQPERSMADFRAALEINPQFIDAYNNRGFIHLQNGELEKALADFDKCLELDPRNGKAYDNRGLVRFQQQRFEQAIADFSSSLKFRPQYAKAHLHRAKAYARRGQVDRAVADLETALEIDPEHRDSAGIRRLIKKLRAPKPE